MGEFILSAVIFVFSVGMAVISVMVALGGLYYGLIAIGVVIYFITFVIIYPLSKICALYAVFISRSFQNYEDARSYFESEFERKIGVAKEVEKAKTEVIKQTVNDRRENKKKRKEARNAAKKMQWKRTSYIQSNTSSR